MFFMTRKRFEDEVRKRIEAWKMEEIRTRDMCEFNSRLYKVEERLEVMERKALVEAKFREVCKTNDA